MAIRRSLLRLVVVLQVFLLVTSLVAPVAALAEEPSADPSPTPSAEPSTEPSAEPTPEATPSEEPTADPTPAPTPEATPEQTAPPATPTPTAEPTPAEPAAPPTIASDLDDYPPGGLVTLTGSNWQPGEVVHIFVNDDWGSSWSRNVDVTADANGNISDQFNLPNWFAAFYGVVAMGSSGVATTTFTDKNVDFTSPDPTRFPASGSQSIAPGATHNFSATIEEAGGNGTTTITGITSQSGGGQGPCTGTASPLPVDWLTVRTGAGGSTATPFVLSGSANIQLRVTVPAATATGQYQGRFQLSVDGGNTNDTLEFCINVTGANAAPVVTAPANQSANEGSSTSFNLGSFTDVAADTPWAVSVDWGDGSANTTFNTAAAGSLGTANHTYADGPATRTVTVTVTDKNGASGQATFTITVNNVAPTIAISGAASVNEGSSYSLTLGAISDPGSDTVTSWIVHWGDGSSNTYTSGGVKTHTYADGPNDYDVTVDLLDEDSDPAYHLDRANDLAVHVNNAAPVVTAPANQSANEGSSTSFNLGSFTDVAADTPWAVSVDWGDGSANTTFNTAAAGSLGTANHTYADGPATRTVTVTVTDKNGASGQATFTITVNNAAPVVTAPANQSANEGSSTSFNLGSFTDVAADTPWAVSVDWGDGSANTTFNTAAAGSLGTANHTYADGPATRTVTVTVTDKNGASGQATFTITVNNVAPTIAISGAASVNEGSSYSLTLGAISDPGSDTVTSWIVHWGDGSSNTYTSGGVKTHTYADGPNDYDVTVDLLDEDSDPAYHLDRANDLAVHVNNVAPTIAISGAASVNEGSSYSLTLGAISDPGSDTVTSWIVHWGDGSSNTYTSGGVKTHTYADGPNDYDVTVDLLDEDSDPAYHLDRANDLAVHVNNVAPTIAISGAASVNEGSSYSLTLGAISDPGSDTVTSWIVHWGDGSSNTYTSGGVKTHTYADGPNDYDVTVDLLDEDSDPAYHLDRANDLAVHVNNVAPTIAISGAASVNEGSSYSLTLGAISDPGSDTVTSWIVHWGDGSSNTYTSGGVKTHTYADGPNDYDVTVDLLDEDSDPAYHLDRANDLAVHVNNVAPTIAISGAASVNEGSSYSLTLGAISDPGSDTVTSWIVHWGDGSSNTYTSGGVKTHTYADGPNDYDVTVDLLDEDSDPAYHLDRANDLAVHVNNVAPTIAISGAASVNEGSSYSLTLGAISDPGSDTVTSWIVHWGDGSSNTYTSGGVKTHTYADGPNDYDVTVDLLDEDSDPAYHLDRANDLAVHVNNVKPDTTIGTITGTGGPACLAGNSVTLNFLSTDPAGANDVYSYSVNWGDGSLDTTGSGGASPAGGLSHTYGAGGPFVIVVTVNDDDPGAGVPATASPFSLLYTSTGIQQPINGTGSRSSFKIGSTIPVKLNIVDCSGNLVSGLTLTVGLVKLDNNADPANETVPASVPDVGTTMRANGTGAYIYNLSTKRSQLCSGPAACTAGGDLTAGSYRLTITGALISPVVAYFDAKQ